MFTNQETENALKVYKELRSVTAVIHKLGYPTRETLYQWLLEKNNPLKKVKPPRIRINNSPDHPLHPSAELKLETLRHYFECGDNVKLVAEEIGYTIATIYTWRRLYERNGAAAFMRYQDIPRSKLKEPDSSSSKEIPNTTI